jgi:hypothetical protein
LRHTCNCAFVGFLVQPPKQTIPVPKDTKAQFFHIFDKTTFKTTRKGYKMALTKLEITP